MLKPRDFSHVTKASTIKSASNGALRRKGKGWRDPQSLPRLFPNNVDAVVLLGHLRRKQERYQEAFDTYDRAMSLPEASYLHDMKDWVSIHMGNTAIHLEDPETGLKIAQALLDSVEESRKEVRSWAQVLEANSYWHLGATARKRISLIRRKDSPRAYKAAKATLAKMDAEEL